MSSRTIIPIYTTRGDASAFLVYPHLFNRGGEWIGWVTPQREIYSVYGEYAGYLGDGPRILRKRSYSFDNPRLPIPTRPARIRVPATVPLPPMMAELTYSVIDILDEEPERLPTTDTGETRQDLD